MSDFNSKETLEKVLVDLNEKKDNSQELDEAEQESYGEFIKSFSDSLKLKLDELQEGDITPELKSQIETRLTLLTSDLEAMTLEETILKVEEINEILDMQIDIASNDAIENIEQFIVGSEFATELTELSEIIAQNEQVQEEIEDEEIEQDKQDTNVTKLFDPSVLESENNDKSVLSDNDYIEINVGSKTKKFFGKAREWIKTAGSKVKDVVWSPFGAVAGAGVGILSLFSKKFRKGVGKVIGAPFSAIGGGVQKVGNFAVNLVTYPFRWPGGLFRGKKVAFNRTGTTDKSDTSDATTDTPDSFFGGDSVPDTVVADTSGSVAGTTDTTVVDTSGSAVGDSGTGVTAGTTDTSGANQTS